MIRLLATIAIVVVAVWFGSLLAACFGSGGCPPCRGGRPIAGGKFTITKSSAPEALGGEVDASVDRFVIRYRVDGTVHEVIFRVTRS